MSEPRDSIPGFIGLALAFSLAVSLETALAETRSVIDPVEAPEPQRPPAPRAKGAPQPDEAVKRERRQADAVDREAAARAAARKAAASRAAARAAAAKAAKAKAAEAARKEAQREAQKEAQREAQKEAQRRAAAREAAARRTAAREAIAREARETAAREAAARETAMREAAAREAAMREAAAREARETAMREAAAREAAAKEAAALAQAAREAAAREAAAREAAAREAAKEAAAREAMAREAAAREAAAKEAAAREAAVRRAKLAAGHESLEADSRTANGRLQLKVFRDCAECPEVVWLPKGELPPGEPNAAGGPRYALKVSYVLAVGRFKVSIAEWDACVADRGCRRRPDAAGWSRGRDPVTNVSWEDAQQYATWLSRRTSKPYRLLTGPEWEYAARNGSEVYDMHGGVSEWVENCYQYRDARTGNGGWKLECTNQTLRGGGQRDAVYRTGVSRSFAPFNHYDDRIGFRIARTE